MDRGKQLADDHWEYIEALLNRHSIKLLDLGIAEFHYKTAFIHGYKHGKEDKESK